MYNDDRYYPCPSYNPYKYPCPWWDNRPIYHPDYWRRCLPLKDYGPNPLVFNIEEATLQNTNFRIALWTGEYFQITLMSIDVGDDIGLEMHPDVDQFIRIEQGEGLVMMGDTRDRLTFRRRVKDDFAIVIPAGKWHNLVNTGCKPIKLYSIYAPPEHPFGTIHRTKADDPHHHDY